MSEVSGGCYCGAVRYRILERPGTGICYCESCRKAVGGQSVVWLLSHRDRVEVAEGKPASYTAPNGAVWSFCACCGSTLFWEPGDESGTLTVTIGTVDEPASFAPENSSWKEDRLPWDIPPPKKVE